METVADLANAALEHDLRKLYNAPHRLDTVAKTPPAGTREPKAVQSNPQCTKNKLQQWDVYVDDFLGLSQGNPSPQRMIKRALLHALDQVFRPLNVNDNTHRQELASLKKLWKGDGTWTTLKEILGWLIDTITGTIELTPHQKQCLDDILTEILATRKKVPVQLWHKVLGELRSMTIAIPGAR